MNIQTIREKYLAYMEKQGHVVIPSAALVPENDPTTLFTGSGMQPLVPYLMGETHPKGTRLTDAQKCFRAADIEEVGDNRHTTFFEMLGNWSLGDYFKEEQLTWFYTFLTDELGIDPERLYVTVFQGDETLGVPRDNESVEIWQKLFSKKGVSAGVADMGSEASGYERGMQEGERIFYYDGGKNWWSRAGKPEDMPAGEIGGPDSEMFYEFTDIEHDTAYGTYCHPNCDCGRFMEIGNSVFMQYLKEEDGAFVPLPKQNVDFGGGVERIAAAAENVNDVFRTPELFACIEKIAVHTNETYDTNPVPFRVITDHIRGATFMIGDGVLPSNTEQGYFVRRLIRRAVRYADILGIPEGTLAELSEAVIAAYGGHYTNLTEKHSAIIDAIRGEEEQFRKTLEKGLRQFEKNIEKGTLNGEDVYILFTTYGFPYELVEELATERGITISREDFTKRMEEHRAVSREGAAQKFKGGLADHSEKVVAYHTATHLLLAGLRKVLGNHVHQAGSNITGERLRFDFTHPAKMTDEEKQAVEEYVNNVIRAHATVSVETLSKADAEQDPTVEGSFWEKYPDEVKIYTVRGDDGVTYSRELCGGPHVESTDALAGTFRIKKEESSSQGIRRIKAVLD